MHNLRNETKNNRIKSVLDELICYIKDEKYVTNSYNDPLFKTIEDNSFPAEEEFESNYDEDSYGNYDHQQDSSNNLVTESHRTHKVHLFEIPLGELPCPQEEHETETPSNYLITPAYAEINFGKSSTLKALTCLIFLGVWICLT